MSVDNKRIKTHRGRLPLRLSLIGVATALMATTGFTAPLAQAADPVFAQMPQSFVFTSGAGGWDTTLTMKDDGSFTGYFHDNNMGETGPGYPKGTMYESRFSGSFKVVSKVNSLEYKLELVKIKQQGTVGNTKIDNGLRVITTEPYGMGTGKDFRLYLPGRSVAGLPTEFLDWVRWEIVNGVFETWVLRQTSEECGFMGVGGIMSTPVESFTLGVDMTGDGRGEILAVDSKGVLWMLPTTPNARLGQAHKLATGMKGVQIFAPGDLNSDKKPDILAITSNGDLWLYPGNGAAPLAAPTKVGWGWKGWRLIPSGDVTSDGKADLLGINKDGILFMYAGKGNGKFEARKQVGWGWKGWELYSAGDLNKDKKADILGINSKGDLYQYTGKGNGTFNARQKAGWGWIGYTLAAGADLTGDGLADIVGANNKTHKLYLYVGLGNAKFKSRVELTWDW